MKIPEIYKLMKENLILDSGPKAKYAHKYFFRPLSVFIAVPLAYLRISSNSITYFRAVMISVLFIVSIFINSNQIVIIFFTALFCQILDFVDGNLARFYKTQSLYGKFIDGLFDFLIPLVYFHLPFISSREGVNLQVLKIELFITIFIIFSFGFSAFYGMRHRAFKPINVEGLTIIGNTVIDRNFSSENYMVDNSRQFFKKNKNRAQFHRIFTFFAQTHLLFSLFLAISGQYYYIIYYLLILRIFATFLLYRNLRTLNFSWKNIKY
ncbi:MAG: hypothetical protein CMI90_05420 [Pelagibacteraceae bacterium]|nr:hypothetical protein [Pelagibacteraceae bacterium]